MYCLVLNVITLQIYKKYLFAKSGYRKKHLRLVLLLVVLSVHCPDVFYFALYGAVVECRYECEQ